MTPEMTRDRLHDLVAQGEGPALEFKRSLPGKLGRALCAFANSGGGALLVGVTGRGRIVGVPDHSRAEARIRSVARSGDPPIQVEIDVIDELLRVYVPPQPHGPYSFRGRFYRRDGAATRWMSRAEIEDLFRAAEALHFDRTPCANFDLRRDLDDEAWALFSTRARLPDGIGRTRALRTLGLIGVNGRMTHAGAWLMARDIRTVTASAHTSCALFLGRTEARTLDRRDFHGDVPSMIEAATAWILSKINVEPIVGGARSEERPELPEDALREAVANAVAHRDYRSPENVQVRVFKDRVEVVSPGGLPAGMAQADLGAGSLPRNPLLFSVLCRMGVAGPVGSGIRRILDRCREHGVPAPGIDVSEHRVAVTFPRPDDEDGEDDCRPEPEPEARPESTKARVTARIRPEPEPDEVAEEADDGGARPREGSLDQRVLALLVDGPMAKSAIARGLGHRSVSGGLNRVIRRLRGDGLVEYTLPEKPNSSRQEYRITAPGLLALEEASP